VVAVPVVDFEEVVCHEAHRLRSGQAATAEWEFHNMLLGVKDQVIAQYGKDSDQVSTRSTYQVQALGLKKKSERKAPARKAKPSA